MQHTILLGVDLINEKTKGCDAINRNKKIDCLSQVFKHLN